MPRYRGISLNLRSQYDVDLIPEYAPPASRRNLLSLANCKAVSPPPLFDAKRRTVSVYVPQLASSLFWLCYEIFPDADLTPGQFFVVKLYLSGEHVVTWCCGEDDQWKGKTMFGLYDDGKKGIEKRVLAFAPAQAELDLTDGYPASPIKIDKRELEIRVFRADGKQRIKSVVENFEETGAAQKSAEGGVKLLQGGPARKGDPKRFYKFRLVDPLDKPHATFRYLYRSWEEFDQLGISTPSPSEQTPPTGSGELSSPYSSPYGIWVEDRIEKRVKKAKQKKEQPLADDPFTTDSPVIATGSGISQDTPQILNLAPASPKKGRGSPTKDRLPPTPSPPPPPEKDYPPAAKASTSSPTAIQPSPQDPPSSPPALHPSPSSYRLFPPEASTPSMRYRVASRIARSWSPTKRRGRVFETPTLEDSQDSPGDSSTGPAALTTPYELGKASVMDDSPTPKSKSRGSSIPVLSRVLNSALAKRRDANQKENGAQKADVDKKTELEQKPVVVQKTELAQQSAPDQQGDMDEITPVESPSASKQAEKWW